MNNEKEYYTCINHPLIQFNENLEFRYKNSLIPVNFDNYLLTYQDNQCKKQFNILKEVLLTVYNLEKCSKEIGFYKSEQHLDNLSIATYDVIDIYNNYDRFLSLQEIAECYNMDIKDVKKSYYNSQKISPLFAIKKTWVNAKDF